MPGIPDEVLCKYRCHYVVENFGNSVLQQVIKWLDAYGNCLGKTVKERLFEIPGFSETKYKKEFNCDQRKKIANEPLESYDITLSYKVLQRVCGLAPLTDASWCTIGPQGPSLEYKIQEVKKLRNTLAHEEKVFSEAETRQLVDGLRQTLVDILTDAGARTQVLKDEVDRLIVSTESQIQNVYDKIREPLDPTDITHFHRLQEEARSFKIQLKDELLKISHDEVSELFLKLCKIEPAPWALHQRYEANPTQVFVRVKVKEDKNLSSNRGAEQVPEIPCDDILEIKTPAGGLPQVIILSGEGGRGKTSLLKYFLEEFLKGPDCSVKKLTSTEMLLHIEARNDQIGSFKDLLKCCIPQAYARMALSYEHLSDILLDVQKLILIDGFDEHNPTSRKLVKELLHLPGNNRFIITTRPSSVEDVNMIVPTSKSKLNLQLQGIPEDQHGKFVEKLLSSLVPETEVDLARDELMKCLNRLKQTLGEQLNTPLTLALVVLLYVVSPDTISNLTSSSDLYEELRRMMTDKLVFRLVTSTDDSERAAKKKCKKFLEQFDQISFRTFCKKEYELRSNTTEKLTEVCEDLDLPEELVLSTYLNTKRSLRGIGTIKIFTYQHLMMQEFAAGRYLAKKVIAYLEENEFTVNDLDNEMTEMDLNKNCVNGLVHQEGQEKILDDSKNKMPLFSGLSSEKATKQIRNDGMKRRKLSENSNMIWKVLREEYPQIAKFKTDLRDDFIHRAQNVLMFMTGAIRAEYEEHLVSVANDIVQLVEDEKTNNGQPYIDILMRLIAESGNNDEITRVVSKEVELMTRNKYCIVRENSLSVFQSILRFTCPDMIAVDIHADPLLVSDLMPTLRTIASSTTKLSLVFRHMYHDGKGGEGQTFLQLFSSSKTCELAEYWGAVSEEGMQWLPESLGVLCLRMPPQHLQALNSCFHRLTNLWSVAAVVELSYGYPPSSLVPVAFEGQRLVLLVAAAVSGTEEEVAWAVDALAALCPPAKNRQVAIAGLWNSNIKYEGAERLLRRLHAEGFGVTEFVVVRTTELMSQAEQRSLTELGTELGICKVLIIKDSEAA